MPDRRVIGVDMGGTKLLAGVVDAGLAVQHRLQVPVRGLIREDLLDTVHRAVKSVLSAAAGPVDAVGFGIPSLIDRRTGISVYCNHLALAGVPFAEVMSERLGLPCFIDNDGNLAALAEHRAGAAAGVEDAIVICLGTGIAGGLILGGALYRGSIGSGAEIGHMVLDADGPPCQGNCPNHGCFEVLASGTALEREARRIGAEQPAGGLGRAVAAEIAPLGPVVTELAAGGDPAALEVFSVIGGWLGVAAANCVNLFNPAMIVVGGGVISAGELLLAPARAEMLRRALAPSRDVVEVVPAHFGAEAGMIGAAVMALDELTGKEGVR